MRLLTVTAGSKEKKKTANFSFPETPEEAEIVWGTETVLLLLERSFLPLARAALKEGGIIVTEQWRPKLEKKPSRVEKLVAEARGLSAAEKAELDKLLGIKSGPRS